MCRQRTARHLLWMALSIVLCGCDDRAAVADSVAPVDGQTIVPDRSTAPDGTADTVWLDAGLQDGTSDPCAKLTVTTKAYLEFLEFGGQIRFEVLTTNLLRTFLKRSLPILTGLSATYLYNSSREYGLGSRLIADDIRGEPTGHFVVLAGYDGEKRGVLVADPLKSNPVSTTQNYEVKIDRLVCAIMLGALTHDANFLIIEPLKKVTGRSIHGDKDGD